MTFRLTRLSAQMAKLGLKPAAATRGAQNQDFRLWSIEFGRPAAIAEGSRRARALHSSNDWMVERK